jgi:hypothetical protein
MTSNGSWGGMNPGFRYRAIRSRSFSASEHSSAPAISDTPSAFFLASRWPYSFELWLDRKRIPKMLGSKHDERC